MIDLERLSLEGPAGRISYLRRAGSPEVPPVLFVHGINGAAEQWSTVMRRLSGRTCLAVDLRGHGESNSAASYGAADYASDVITVLENLGGERIHLVGASFGGGVTLSVAAVRPRRVRSVTVIGGALTVANLVDLEETVGALHQLGPAAFFEMVAAASFAPGTERALLQDSVRVAARNDAGTIEQILRDAFTADVSEAAAQLRAPALVLTGEHDQTCPVPLGRALATALSTQHRVLAGRGHMMHLEDPDLVADLVDTHLRGAEASAPAQAI